ncbi:MAG: acetolactate synthase small subunit [Erysipelotrichaceae bacterium]|nr:acetolactate synthase small subunit [Erysipelotrichaceae bacterium]MCI9524325.1 acetolactate synthase small subunit [Erysipelotrichaceae bacterium]
MKKVVLSLLVSNHFGVLTRVTNLFSSRGYNIISLSVGETENPKFSRITIVTSDDEAIINQIKLQCAKLEDVKAIKEIKENELYMREVVLVKVRVSYMKQEDFMNFVAANKADAKLIEDRLYMVEICSGTQAIDAFIDKLEMFDIVEIARTGGCALSMSTSTVYDEE